MLLSRSGEKDKPTGDLNAPDAPDGFSWREIALAFLSAWLVFVVLAPQITHWLNPPSGDEPFYLMTAISLIDDHDLDETNNYAQKDFWRFSPGCDDIMAPGWASTNYEPGVLAPGLRACPAPYDRYSVDLPPHTSKGVIHPGTYTKHGLGLSFLILLPFALAGRLGAVLMMGMLASLLGVNLLLLAWETTGNRQTAWIAWAIQLFTVPFFVYGFLIFPAIPAALCLIYAFRRIRLAQQGFSNNGWQTLMAGVCLGFLPWLHSLYLSLSAPLFAYWLLGGRNAFPAIWNWLRKPQGFAPRRLLPPGWKIGQILLFLAPIVFFGALFCTYYQYYYGMLQPNEQDHAGFVGWDQIGTGALGLFFDQKWGLLVYAPVYLLGLAGLVLLLFPEENEAATRQKRSDFIWITVISLPYFSFIARYAQWWGEWCPPARYLTPILPLLALPMALVINRLDKLAIKVALVLLSSWSLTVSVIWILDPKLLFHWQDQQPAKILQLLHDKIDWLGGLNLPAYFPSYVTTINGTQADSAGFVQLAWIAIFVIAGTGIVWTVRHFHPTPDQPS